MLSEERRTKVRAGGKWHVVRRTQNKDQGRRSMTCCQKNAEQRPGKEVNDMLSEERRTEVREGGKWHVVRRTQNKDQGRR